MPLSSDREISDLLANARQIAVVGVSNDPTTQSYQVAAYQQSQGYHLIPITPDEDAILGFATARRLEDAPGQVDVVDVFAHPNEVSAIADAAIAKGAKALWLQPGSATSEAVQKAEAAGIPVVIDKCFMGEHRRLLSRQPI